MSGELYQAIAENRVLLENEVLLRLNASSVLQKNALDEELLRDRIGRLVDKLLASLRDNPEVFVSYVESTTDECIDEGIVLHEMQLALIVLEEKVWQIVVEWIPLEDQVHCLGLVTLIIGTAKDRVAHIFLHYLEMVESEVSFLRRQSGCQDQGTAASPRTEADLNWQRGTPKPHHEIV